MIENMMTITADRKLHSWTLHDQYYYVLSLILLQHSKSAVMPILDSAQMYNKELFFYICFIPSANIKNKG